MIPGSDHGFLVAEAYAAEAAAPQRKVAAGSSSFRSSDLRRLLFLPHSPAAEAAERAPRSRRWPRQGDEVVTSGGLTGTVTKVEDEFVVCRVAEKTELRFQKHAVVATLPKGTLKKSTAAPPDGA